MKPSNLDIKQLEDIATLKADMSTVKSDIKDVKKQIGDFIKSADKKYATKEEVRSLRAANKDIKTELVWTKEKLFDVTTKVASLASTVGLLTKLMGLW